jgi:hypothetical protein
MPLRAFQFPELIGMNQRAQHRFLNKIVSEGRTRT